MTESFSGNVCVCVWEPLSIPSSSLLSSTLSCRIEMQFLSLVFELPTRPVLMAADGPRSSTRSFCCLLMYAALLKHYSVFYDLADIGGGGNLYISEPNLVSNSALSNYLFQSGFVCLNKWHIGRRFRIIVVFGQLKHLGRSFSQWPKVNFNVFLSGSDSFISLFFTNIHYNLLLKCMNVCIYIFTLSSYKSTLNMACGWGFSKVPAYLTWSVYCKVRITVGFTSSLK